MTFSPTSVDEASRSTSQYADGGFPPLIQHRSSRPSTAARSVPGRQRHNFSYFNDPAFNRKLKTAGKLSGAQRYRTYGRLEIELQRDLVPAAAFAINVSHDFFSARIGCQIYQPVNGMDIAALCLRS